jgi:predicted Fe-S protein YdhL (DUF1289 family)
MPASNKGAVMQDEPASPCTGICKIDPLNALCRGCARTIDEIVRWPAATTDQRRAILAVVAQRRRLAGQGLTG